MSGFDALGIAPGERLSLDKGFKLFNDTYMFLTETCILIVKVDDAGDIVRVSAFGKKERR